MHALGAGLHRRSLPRRLLAGDPEEGAFRGGEPLLGMEKFVNGALDDDEATLKATMARILSVGDTAAAPVTIHRSAASARDRRQRLASIA